MGCYRGEGQRAWTAKSLEMLDERVQFFERMLVDIFDGHCDSGLYILKYTLLDLVVESSRNFRTLSVLDSIPYEHLKCTPSTTIEKLWRGKIGQ